MKTVANTAGMSANPANMGETEGTVRVSSTTIDRRKISPGCSIWLGIRALQSCSALLHMPAVADHDGPAGQRVIVSRRVLCVSTPFRYFHYSYNRADLAALHADVAKCAIVESG